MHKKIRSGFTLIELLVVISIIAMILAVSLPNFLGSRERARDTKKKAELNQLKTALRLYYNDFGHYPGQAGGLNTLVGMKGCGVDGSYACPTVWCPSVDFATGPISESGCSNVYLKKFPAYTTGTLNYFSDGADNYRLSVNLENPSDPDIAASQSRCPSSYPNGNPSGANCSGAKTYCACPE